MSSEYEKWIEALYEQASNENDPEAAGMLDWQTSTRAKWRSTERMPQFG